MARANKVWKRTGTDWYYAKIRGKKVRLSKDREEAEKLMHQLLGEEPEETANADVNPTFRKIADLYLVNSQNENKPTTFRMHKIYLQSFCDRIKRKRVGDLKVHHVSEWIASTGWGQSTSCSARGTVLAALNWAVEQGYLKGHPLGKLKRGSIKRRERVFSADELVKIRGFVKPDFGDFVRALELTGARPFSELALVSATADGWEEAMRAIADTRRMKPKKGKPTAEKKWPKPGVVNWAEQTITFGDHKNEKKGKTRTIYLVPELTEILKRLAKIHPTGPLFRNSLGGLWTSHDATRRLHHATEKLGIPKGTIYAVRHHRISAALESGLSANVIAELCGNSPITIARHYDHLSKQKKFMLKAAQQALGEPPPASG